MKSRAVLLAASLVLVGTAGYASAAPAKAKAAKPVCNLVADAKGDAAYNNVPGADGDDIVSADVASDATTITGVLRTAALTSPDPQAPFGRGYFVLFSAPGSADQLFVSARTYPQGTTFVYGYQGVDPNTGVNTSYTLGQATGVLDAAKSEVRISVPIKALVDGAKAKLAPGTKLSALTAQTYRIAGQGFVPSQSPAPGAPRVPIGGVLLPFDDATGSSYVMSTPSCVVVGK
jgi:hypothetical protein